MIILDKAIKRYLPEPLMRDFYSVEIGRGGITFRRKKARKPLPTVPWGKVFQIACNIAVAEAQREKAERRALRYGGSVKPKRNLVRRGLL